MRLFSRRSNFEALLLTKPRKIGSVRKSAMMIPKYNFSSWAFLATTSSTDPESRMSSLRPASPPPSPSISIESTSSWESSAVVLEILIENWVVVLVLIWGGDRVLLATTSALNPSGSVDWNRTIAVQIPSRKIPKTTAFVLIQCRVINFWKMVKELSFQFGSIGLYLWWITLNK